MENRTFVSKHADLWTCLGRIRVLYQNNVVLGVLSHTQNDVVLGGYINNKLMKKIHFKTHFHKNTFEPFFFLSTNLKPTLGICRVPLIVDGGVCRL